MYEIRSDRQRKREGEGEGTESDGNNLLDVIDERVLIFLLLCFFLLRREIIMSPWRFLQLIRP